jgi:DNA replication licensing factor MCM2
LTSPTSTDFHKVLRCVQALSAANRGPRNLARQKRARDEEDEIPSSSPAPALPSSPPLLPTNENDEVKEDDLIGDIDDADEMAEDEDGIDLFGDNFMQDERERRDQETYQGRMIDDDEKYDELDAAARRQLEARLDKLD